MNGWLMMGQKGSECASLDKESAASREGGGRGFVIRFWVVAKIIMMMQGKRGRRGESTEKGSTNEQTEANLHGQGAGKADRDQQVMPFPFILVFLCCTVFFQKKEKKWTRLWKMWNGWADR